MVQKSISIPVRAHTTRPSTPSSTSSSESYPFAGMSGHGTMVVRDDGKIDGHWFFLPKNPSQTIQASDEIKANLAVSCLFMETMEELDRRTALLFGEHKSPRWDIESDSAAARTNHQDRLFESALRQLSLYNAGKEFEHLGVEMNLWAPLDHQTFISNLPDSELKSTLTADFKRIMERSALWGGSDKDARRSDKLA